MSQAATQRNQETSLKAGIFVCGELSLTSEVFCHYLGQTTGHRCSVGSLRDLLTLLKDTTPHDQPRIVLLDYDCVEVRDGLFNELSELLILHDDVYAIVYNFNPDKRVKKLLSNGMRGVLYPTDHHQTMIKAVNAVMKGQMWIPRQAMTACLEELGDRPLPSRSQAQVLTPREREILSSLSSGNTNDEIASTLFISPFTVKVHIQNIFRKIGVPNRVKAALWAQDNLRL